jgi:hypothetical protein
VNGPHLAKDAKVAAGGPRRDSKIDMT